MILPGFQQRANARRRPPTDHEISVDSFAGADGWVLLGSKSQQVASIGNSVCPHVARAIVKANVKIRRAEVELQEASA